MPFLPWNFIVVILKVLQLTLLSKLPSLKPSKQTNYEETSVPLFPDAKLSKGSVANCSRVKFRKCFSVFHTKLIRKHIKQMVSLINFADSKWRSSLFLGTIIVLTAK